MLGDLLLAKALRVCYGAGKTFAFVVIIFVRADDSAEAFYQ